MLVKRFESQVRNNPDKLAVKAEDDQMTYLQLNQAANRLAHFIIHQNLTEPKEMPVVGLLFEHGAKMIVAMLGTLKSKTIYVPLDIAYPKERLIYMLEHSGATLLVTNTQNLELAQQITQASSQVITIINLDQLKMPNTENPNLEIIGEEIAYILYTSGSTGNPKGVVQNHQNIWYFVQNYIRKMSITAEDRLTLFSAFSHDAAVLDIYCTLIIGATVYPLNIKNQASMMGIPEWLLAEGITVWHSVPTLFRYFLNILEQGSVLPQLRIVVLGGDSVLAHDVMRFKKMFQNTSTVLANLYGQSESSFNSAQFIGIDTSFNKVTLGNVIDEMEILLINEHGEEALELEVGEIIIASEHIALGYWKNPEKTAEVFLNHPELGKLYRTGDLGRLDGEQIEHMGRKDFQIKVRGYRVELGEIESKIMTFKGIREVVVIAKEDEGADKSLCAFIVADEECGISELRVYLADKLPEYMIPVHLVALEQIPLTPNKKVDRKSLIQLVQELDLNAQYLPPTSQLEAQLVIIWEEILNRKPIGIIDNFFAIGGHSLEAAQLRFKILKELEVEVPLKEIFKTPTIEELAKYIEKSQRSHYAAIPVVEKREHYPVSSAQKRLFILNQLTPEDISYNMPGILLIESQVDMERLEEVFYRLIQRHDSFRTSFTFVAGEPVQQIATQVDFTIPYTELEITDRPEEEVVRGLAREFIRPFDLSKAPLLRVKLVKLAHARYILMYDMHHIISDGVSMQILTNEFRALYQGEEIPELRIQYKDFTVWQNQLFCSDTFAQQEEYWLTRFAGEIPILDLPTDFLRPVEPGYTGDSIGIIMEEELTAKFKQMATQLDVTSFMSFLAIYNLLLFKYTGQEDIIVGSPIAGRPHGDLEHIIGIFVNTLALRNYPLGEKTFKEFAREVKDHALQAYENQDYQFEMLVDRLNLQRDLSRNPLFDTMLTLHNLRTLQNREEQSNLAIHYYPLSGQTAKFDLSLDINDTGDRFGLRFEYCTQLFTRETVERLANHFINLITEVMANPEIKLKDVQMISKIERDQLIYTFNDNKRPILAERTIHQLIEEQASRIPEKIAVVYGEEELNYREFNQRSNKLARLLKRVGLTDEGLVGIMFERSPLMMESIMATWKAGGAYIPIDPDYPVQRVNGILEDSGAQILLTKSVYLTPELSSGFTGKIIQLDLDEADYLNEENTNLDLNIAPANLAYVIYTSGSTGKPKGAMVEQIGMMNHMQSKIADIEVTEESIIVQNASHCFDISVWQFFVALVVGGQTVIYSNELALNPAQLFEQVREDRVTILEVVPSFLGVLLDLLEVKKLEERGLPDLKYLLVTGEILKQNLVKRWFQLYSGIKMVNAYGPTEASDDITHYIMDTLPELNHIPIGASILNFNIYIVDKYMKLCPRGVKGEICVAGIGVGRGYLNNPEKTQAVFMEDPFTEKKGVRLYKTGDLGRFMPDGNIQFFGRKDYQVKIRGFRIEMGEIENILIKHPEIKETIVVDRDDLGGNKFLCAYIVADREISVVELRQYLGQHLPEYMIPAFFVHLDGLPLNPNGKVDRKALPEPTDQIMTGVEYQPPTNQFETVLTEIWTEILGIPRVGINDNFFELGGNSLKATSLVAKVNREFDVTLPLREIFKTPTIKGLADYIQDIGVENLYEAIQPVAKADFYPLSSAQKRLYVIDQLEGIKTTYNITNVLSIEGDIELARLEEAFQKLIQRHESLRTSFDYCDGQPVQVVHSEAEFAIDFLIASDDDEKIVIQEYIRPFDLRKAPLLRVGVLRTEEKDIVIFDMHHIISDGLSMEILTREVLSLYLGKQLVPLRIQYKDFAVWQNQLFASEKLVELEEYWLKRFSDEIPVLDLSTDYPRPLVRNFTGDRSSIMLDSQLAQNLHNLAKEQGVTTYMVLLSALNILLAKYSGQEDIIIGSPIAGRPHADLEQIIGMFVNTLAMRNYPKGEKTYQEFLAEVRENALQAFEHQDYQFEMLVGKLDLERNLGRNPLFDVVFTLQSRQMNLLNDANKAKNLQLTPLKFTNKTAKFDLTVNAIESNGQINLSFEYSTQLFKEKTIQRLIGHFTNILDQITTTPNIYLKEIQLVADVEREQILHEFNGTSVTYPKDKTVLQLFEEQVERSPERIAVDYQGLTLSYQELNFRANQLARTLRDLGVRPDEPVAIMIEHSVEMIIGVLAIGKAGGAYLPINPDYPAERVDFMIRDADARFFLTRKGLEVKPGKNIEIIDLHDPVSYHPDGSNLSSLNSPDDLIYIMYTSGSTGTPKGVMITHQNVNRLIKNSNMLIISEDDRILQTGSLAFDASTFEIWGSLLNGACLYLVDKDNLLSATELECILKANQISMIWMTAPLFNQMLEENPETFTDLKTLIVGGDALSARHIQQVRNLCPALQVINGYGPTESTTFTTYYVIKKDYGDNIPIGKPVSNTRVYILDRHNQLQPVGVPGELCIAGDGLARGYLKRPELTRSRFVSNPLNPNERIYRSGDLARWLDDGNIQFLGRIDHQVKIRGFRIEPEEIEHQLLTHPEIKEVVIVLREDQVGVKYLTAYFVADQNLSVMELRSFLHKRLPDYMIPSYFIQLEKMPLTPNGKIDRRHLPILEGPMCTGREYVAPENEVEERLVKIWCQVLELPKVGVMDNFFELGGHSLKLISTLKLINQEFQTNYSISMLFLNPTIRSFSESMEKEMLLKDLECIIQLKRGTSTKGSEKNIFCIHPLGGAIHWYKDFADTMDNTYSIYGVQARGMMQDSELPITVREMVACYIEEITKVQPEGPYIIVAFCAGSLLAYEMVRQLERAHRIVDKCILLDSTAFRLVSSRRKNNVASVLRYVGGLFKKKATNQEVSAQEKEVAATLVDEVAVRQKQVEENILQIMSKYQPANLIKSDIFLLKAEDNPNERISVEHWAPLTSGQVYLIHTPGDHFSMMELPLVQETVNRVQEILLKETQE